MTMEFFDWTTLITHSGALVMVMIITQLTKEIKLIKKLPTQIWSYIITLLILYPAYLFTGQLTVSNAVLILFNSAVVALSANGGFDALKRSFPTLFN